MEEDIREKLEDIYNLEINVKFIDYRQYEIYIRIDREKSFCIPILYDNRSTLEGNITDIKAKIDNEIIKLYRKK